MAAFGKNDDGGQFSALSASLTFNLLGGRYAVAVNATWGGGSATLQLFMPDGTTLVTILAAFTADGAAIVDLPPGKYQLTIVAATAVQGCVARVPYRAA